MGFSLEELLPKGLCSMCKYKTVISGKGKGFDCV